MTEEKLWGYIGDQDNDYEYGRDVLTEDIFDNFLILPYEIANFDNHPTASIKFQIKLEDRDPEMK